MTTLTSPVTWAQSKSAGSHTYAHLLAAQLFHAISSSVSLRNLGALAYGGNLAGMMSDTRRFRMLDGLGVSELGPQWQDLGETASPTDVGWDVGHADVTVARRGIGSTQSFLRQALGAPVNQAELGAYLARAYESKWNAQVCTLGSTATGTAVGNASGPLSVLDLEDVTTHYAGLDTDGLPIIYVILNSTQSRQLDLSLNSLPQYRAKVLYDFFGLTVKPMGFQYRIGNLAIFKLSEVVESAGVVQGFAFVHGRSMGWANSDMSRVDTSGQRAIPVSIPSPGGAAAHLQLLFDSTDVQSSVKCWAIDGFTLMPEEADLIVPIRTAA